MAYIFCDLLRVILRNNEEQLLVLKRPERQLYSMVLIPLSYAKGRVGSSEDNCVWCQPVPRTTRV